MHQVGLVHLFEDRSYYRSGVLAVYWYASDGSENPAQGREEEAAFDHAEGFAAYGYVEQVGYYEVEH